MNTRPPDPIADLNATIELLMGLVQQTEAQVGQLNALAGKLESQASVLEGRISAISDVQTTQLEKVDAAVTHFEQALDEMRQQSAALLGQLSEEFAARRQDIEDIHAGQVRNLHAATARVDEAVKQMHIASNEALQIFHNSLVEAQESQRQSHALAQASFQRELAAILSEAGLTHEEHHKVLAEASATVRAKTTALVEDSTATFDLKTKSLQHDLHTELDKIAGTVRKEMQESLALWKDTKATEQAVKSIAGATRETLEALKLEIIEEIRRPWWRKHKGE